MPYGSLKIKPTVEVNETPALNEAGISSCNLIRFFYDSTGIGLVQKIGGWTKFYPSTMVSPVRGLWAWEDTADVAHLAVGCQDEPGSYQSQLSVITDGVQSDITPRTQQDNITAVVSSNSGSAIVTITDTTIQNITKFDCVYIPTHISIGGVILFGLYQCNPDGHSATTTWTLQSVDKLWAPLAASSTSSSPTLAQFSTTNGSAIVTVTLANHGFVVGDTYSVLVPTEVGGITFARNYVVQSVPSANTFTITGGNSASATISGFINNNKARFIYCFGIGAIPPGSGFGIGGFGLGGFGTGTGITPSVGSPIFADDWILDNWGEILLACSTTDPVVLTTTSATGNGVTGTVHYTPDCVIAVGESVTISGVTPAGWNGTYTVTAATSSSVSFATSQTSPQTIAGTITLNRSEFQPIWQWDSESGSPFATIIPQAPPVNEGMFLAMPQQQIIAYGSTFTGVKDPLLIRWCDVSDFSVWTANVTNQAGSFRIPKGSKIVGAIQTPQQGLIWTDLGLWSMQYINQPLIYSFNEIGSGCGLIAKKAAGTLNGTTYWMGPSQFFMLGAEGVETLPCSIWDVVFQNLDRANVDKIRFGANSLFGEIMWFYPSASGDGEVDSYVKYNVVVQGWDYGSLARSAWLDQSVLGPPIGADPNSLYLYQHETSTDADGQAINASFRTGWFSTGEGEYKNFVDQWWPDMKYGYFDGMQDANVKLTFYAADYPEQTPQSFGPFNMTKASTFLTPRIRSRLLSIEISSDDVGSFWRIGNNRYRSMPDGKF